MEHPLLSTFMLNRSSNFHVGLWKAPNTWYIIETLTSRKSSCSLVCSDDQDVEYFGGTFKISQCSIFWYLLFIYKKNLGLYHSDMLNSNWKCETCVNEWTKLVITKALWHKLISLQYSDYNVHEISLWGDLEVACLCVYMYMYTHMQVFMFFFLKLSVKYMIWYVLITAV